MLECVISIAVKIGKLVVVIGLSFDKDTLPGREGDRLLAVRKKRGNRADGTFPYSCDDGGAVVSLEPDPTAADAAGRVIQLFGCCQ